MNHVAPPCQTQGCTADGTELLRSAKTSLELHLCSECASRYYESGWSVVRGDVELREGCP